MKNIRFGVLSLIMMLILAAALTACTKDETPKNSPANNATNDSTNDSNSGSTNGVEEPGVPEDESQEDPGKAPQEDPEDVPKGNTKDDANDASTTTKQGTGIYNGQMDSHSIEIQTADGPTAFQLADGMDAVLEKLTEDDPVAFEYVEQAIEGDDTNKQLVLTKLEKAASK